MLGRYEKPSLQTFIQVVVIISGVIQERDCHFQWTASKKAWCVSCNLKI